MAKRVSHLSTSLRLFPLGKEIGEIWYDPLYLGRKGITSWFMEHKEVQMSRSNLFTCSSQMLCRLLYSKQTLNKMVELSNTQHSSMLFRLQFFVLSNKSLWNCIESLSLARYPRQSHAAIHWSQENYCRDGFGSTAFWTEFP